MIELEEPTAKRLCERYMEMWNGVYAGRPLADVIASLWTEEAWHTGPRISVRGRRELEARVSRSVQRWVTEERCVFRVRGPIDFHHNVLRLAWEMINAGGGVESVGTETLILADDGKIASAIQFLES